MRILPLLLLGCTAEPTPTAPFDPTVDGPYAPAHLRRVLPADADGRSLVVEVWYPTEVEPGAARSVVEAFATDPDQAAAYQSLLDLAPADCPTRQTTLLPDATPAAGPWPAVVFSHCHECTRFSSFTIAARLASHGLIVAAPDHHGNTLWDADSEEALGINASTLSLRLDDLGRVVDGLVDGTLLPDGLQLDPARLASMGHSFGSGSAALLAQEDPRITATLGLAAPMDNPLVPSLKVDIAGLDLPLLWLIAREDNSITEFGNLAMRSEHTQATGPAWLVEVDDAGHWSFSDLCAVIDGFRPGCGEDERQTAPGEPFTYLPVAAGLQVASTVAAAFFGEQLLGHTGAVDALDLPGAQLTSKQQ
jgi:predicted dienelactone hydrolase